MVAQAGIPRMNLELTWMVARFWIAEKPAGVVWMAAGIAGSPNGVEDLIWPFSLAFGYTPPVSCS
jgi:hypothetical protein